MSQFNVYGTSKKKACVTMSLCTDWFDKHFLPDTTLNCSTSYQSLYKDFRQQADSLVKLQQIEAELPDSDQALPAPANQEEEMVDDPTPSTSHAPSHNCEVLPVCKFWKKYNIKNTVDRIVETWRKINFATMLQTWKPLFVNFEVSGVEQTEASGERQSVAATLMDTVEAVRSVPALGFSDVQVEDLQEIIGQHQQQTTIKEMLEEDEEQEEKQPTQEDDVKPGEPTTLQLTEMLTTFARFTEQLEEHDTRPHAQNHICPVTEKVIEEYKAM
ncbi:hypothetical protein Hamer_G001952 [Homarus americanus]|uniref:Uncharacterized protein n=2 Tax=Homarus americanus TaxID=6706 RepID=A0A8J5JRP6_HOMAM|nr:hypothetical protein Hamer_G001952 [Homarus americanus]